MIAYDIWDVGARFESDTFYQFFHYMMNLLLDTERINV